MEYPDNDYSWTDLRISDNEAAEILKAASLGNRLDEPEGGLAIFNGIILLSLRDMFLSAFHFKEWKIFWENLKGDLTRDLMQRHNIVVLPEGYSLYWILAHIGWHDSISILSSAPYAIIAIKLVLLTSLCYSSSHTTHHIYICILLFLNFIPTKLTKFFYSSSLHHIPAKGKKKKKQKNVCGVGWWVELFCLHKKKCLQPSLANWLVFRNCYAIWLVCTLIGDLLSSRVHNLVGYTFRDMPFVVLLEGKLL